MFGGCDRFARVFLALGLGLLGAGIACRPEPAPSPPANLPTQPPPKAVEVEPKTELQLAISAYRETEDVEPLKRWLAANPKDPDAEIWREFVALRAYERIVYRHDAQDPHRLEKPDQRELLEIADRYPDTIAGDLASGLVKDAGARRLYEPVLNPHLFDFLSGGERWAHDETGKHLLPNVDMSLFYERHAPRLRERLAAHLRTHGCQELMGYCRWWVAQYPDSELTAQLTAQMKEIWYKRAHPRWKGRRHANCAFHCAHGCRKKPTTLEDSCYAQCYARC